MILSTFQTDGRKQTVTYSADDYDGYRAKVTYDGQFNHLEVIPYSGPDHDDRNTAPIDYIISDPPKTELSFYREPIKYKVPIYEPKTTTPASFKNPSMSISSQKEKLREAIDKVVSPSYKEISKKPIIKSTAQYEQEEKYETNYKESSRDNKQKLTETEEEMHKSEPIKTIKVDSKINIYRPESAIKTAPKKIDATVTAVPVVYKPETFKESTTEQTAAIYRAVEPAKTSPWSLVYNPPPLPPAVAPASRPASSLSTQRSPTVTQPSYRTPSPVNYRPSTLPAASSAVVYKPSSSAAFNRPVQAIPTVNRPPITTNGIIPSSSLSGLRYRIVPASSYSSSDAPYRANANAPIAYRLVRKPTHRTA